MKAIILALLCVSFCACAPAPSGLSTAGLQAWHQHEVQKDLDIVRDLAVEANMQTPPILSTETTRKIVLFHKTAITLIHDAPSGWKALVLTSMDALKQDLTVAEYAVIAPYLAVARSVVQSL